MYSPENNLSDIDLTGLDKATVLAALYNGAKPQGAGFLKYDPTPMLVEEAQKLLEERQKFDYLRGRVMKVDLSGNKLIARLYDRDNGENAALTLINSLRKTNDPNNSNIHDHHVSETRKSEQSTRELLHEDSSGFQNNGGIPSYHVGLSEIADLLDPKLRAVRNLYGNDYSKKD